jgi:hypothetical protein
MKKPDIEKWLYPSTCPLFDLAVAAMIRQTLNG